MRTVLHLFRHGQTDWNLTTQHTGHTDLPLNEAGRAEARQLGQLGISVFGIFLIGIVNLVADHQLAAAIRRTVGRWHRF